MSQWCPSNFLHKGKRQLVFADNMPKNAHWKQHLENLRAFRQNAHCKLFFSSVSEKNFVRKKFHNWFSSTQYVSWVFQWLVNDWHDSLERSQWWVCKYHFGQRKYLVKKREKRWWVYAGLCLSWPSKSPSWQRLLIVPQYLFSHSLTQ